MTNGHFLEAVVKRHDTTRFSQTTSGAPSTDNNRQRTWGASVAEMRSNTMMCLSGCERGLWCGHAHVLARFTGGCSFSRHQYDANRWS